MVNGLDKRSNDGELETVMAGKRRDNLNVSIPAFHPNLKYYDYIMCYRRLWRRWSNEFEKKNRLWLRATASGPVATA